MKHIGGGKTKSMQIKVGRHQLTIEGRMGLFGADYGVVTRSTDPDFVGFLIVPKWEEVQRLLIGGADWRTFRYAPEHLRLQLVRDLYHALRQVHHILMGYGLNLEWGEKALIKRALEASQRLDSILICRPASEFNQAQPGYTRRIDGIVDALGTPRNPAKAEAKDKLRRARGSQDSGERYNPTVSRARLTAASRRAELRIDQIMHIEPLLAARQRGLLNYRLMAEWYLEDALGLCRMLRDQSIISRLTPATRDRVANRLDQAATKLRQLDINPYRRNCLLSAADLAAAKQLLLDGFDVEFVVTINRCVNALGLKEVQTRLERLIYLLTKAQERNWHNPPKSALARGVDIRRRLRFIDLAGFREDEEIEAARGRKLNRVVQLLRRDQPDQLIEAKQLLKEISAVI